MYDISLLEKGLEQLNIKPDKNISDNFIKYYELLLEWNKNINLTAITEYEEVINKHFIDSLTLVKAVNLKEDISIIDVGTGGGFPGIPLKLVFPQLNVVLFDSLNKRIMFLKDLISHLNLKGIEAVHGRAEELGKSEKYREKFDVSVSRAVAGLNTLCEYCIPFVKVGGLFVSYKSGNVKDEINISKNAIKNLGGEINEIKEFNLVNTDVKRSLIIIRKVNQTDNRYPRKVGKPSKKPIT